MPRGFDKPRSVVAPTASLDATTYTALGGSNTCGHGLVRSSDAFQQLVLKGLLQRRLASRLQPSCIPAMGPDYPASCIAYFAPNTTAYATLEFTPNMGDPNKPELGRNTAVVLGAKYAMHDAG